MTKLLPTCLLTTALLVAQTFEVASIKPNGTAAQNSGFKRFRGGELNATNISLKMLISFAYDLPQDQILEGPGWLDTERYDIVAKPDAGDTNPPMSRTKLRTRALLADRFKLALRKDTRQMPVFHLLVDNGGPKNLQPPKGTTQDLTSNGHHVNCTAASMDFFARIFLTGQLGRPVLDKTGIQGNYDFSMDWAPDDATDSNAPSFFTAIRQQLGLKLEATKGPVEVLIVEHAEKPSGN